MMTNLRLKRRRESVASAYRKTTKFLTVNTSSFLKIMPTSRKDRFLAKVMEEYEPTEQTEAYSPKDDDSDGDERDLDYYLGVRNKHSCWRDHTGKEEIQKDYLIFHCGVTEEDYHRLYKKTSYPKATMTTQPRLKQVPFKIHRKKASLRDESWREKARLFKLFANKRDSEYSTSDSYSECDSNDGDVKVVDEQCAGVDIESVVYHLNSRHRGSLADMLSIEGVRITEISDGRPCDNCPELCPGFIQHPWREQRANCTGKEGTTDTEIPVEREEPCC